MTESASWSTAQSTMTPNAAAITHYFRWDFRITSARRRDLAVGLPIEPSLVRIRTLGSFSILNHDEPIALAGKMQRKPLELLKVLIALGGQHVAADRLIGNLWPDTLEDGGHKALEITVHRLRKLLLERSALVVSDRHVSLDPRCVWVDALWLDQRLVALLANEYRSSADWEAMERAAAAILQLYRGHFLAGDVDEPWQIPLRNRLCGRLQRFALRLGEHCEGARQWQRAADLYQRVIELDPLAECFYRRRMVCLAALGQRAEAIEVFRRLRHTLSVTLGIAPSSETLIVHKSLLG